MPKLSLQYLAALLLGACLSLAAAAQEDRWYMVELLIFSHEDTVTDEQWDPLPELNYPGAGRFLVYPDAVEARIEQYIEEAGALSAATEEEEFGVESEVDEFGVASQVDEFGVESEVDEFGRQFIRIVPIAPEEAPDIPTVEPPVEEPQATPELEPDEPVEAQEPLYPSPFIALPRASREFYGKAAYMQRSGYYQTLFHEAWVQPVGDEQRAIPLIIDRSGDDQSWPRLQGSVKLYLSRYLHIEADLWLNTQGEYLPEGWRIPAPPLGPLSVVIEKPEPVPEEPDLAIQAPPLEPLDTDLPQAEELEELIEEEGPVYPWRHAVRLNQKRRMRSNEVHYIDHPLLGVVVKLTPLDEEQLQLLAETEAEEFPQGWRKFPGPESTDPTGSNEFDPSIRPPQ